MYTIFDVASYKGIVADVLQQTGQHSEGIKRRAKPGVELHSSPAAILESLATKQHYGGRTESRET